MSEPAPISESFPQSPNASLARSNRARREEAQQVVRGLRGPLRVLAPLIADRVQHVLWRSFPHEDILAPNRHPEYVMARSWAAFYLRHHPFCEIGGAPPSWSVIASLMQRDRATVKYGVKTLIARMKDGRFGKEAHQLVCIATALEIEHDWGPFEIAPFQRAERAKR